MPFHSDNEVGIAPEILAALSSINEGYAMPYGKDELTRGLNRKFSDLFETEVEVFPVATGTASNALALSAMLPPYGAVYCHQEAHILVDECGAVEFYSGGARLIPLPGANGKLHADEVKKVLETQRTDVHYVEPRAISLTQATEFGTVYTIDEVKAIAELAHKHGLHVHMDGARFANAVAKLGCRPADITWRAGVDILCMGASKNGAMAAEAIVIFKKELAKGFARRHKRGGHLFSKMRFMTVQFDAYLEEDRWLGYARHANAMAQKLVSGLTELDGVEPAFPVDANLIFVNMPEAIFHRLDKTGRYQLYSWPLGDSMFLVRFGTAFNTREEDVSELLKIARSSS